MIAGVMGELGIDMNDIDAAGYECGLQRRTDHEVIQILGVPLEDVAVALFRIERRHQVEQIRAPAAVVSVSSGGENQ